MPLQPSETTVNWLVSPVIVVAMVPVAPPPLFDSVKETGPLVLLASTVP